jgi:hypothetical protein
MAVAGFVAVLATGYFIFSSKESKQQAPAQSWPPGFDELVTAGCADTGSMDGTKELNLLDDRSAVLSVRDGTGKHRITGKWSFDESGRRYEVNINGAMDSYSMVAPERTGICMLIKGEHDAADLRASWFALNTD